MGYKLRSSDFDKFCEKTVKLLVVLDMQKIRVRKDIFLYLEALLFYLKKKLENGPS